MGNYSHPIKTKDNVVRQGLETLLDLDGIEFGIGGGYWVKFLVVEVKTSQHRPHGIKYSLTLHNKYGSRLMGFDNAHAAKIKRKKYKAKRVEWDHRHNRKVVSDYEFDTADQLIEDFWNLVEQILEAEGVTL